MNPNSQDQAKSDAKCDAEDLRKIHAELNQILNQRFLLVTTAVTVFGAFSALMVPRINDQSWGSLSKASLAKVSDVATLAKEAAMRTQFENFVFIATVVLVAVFALLFYINWTLLKNQNILAAYLRVFGLSPWERDINQFYKTGVAGTRLYYVAYVFLGILVLLWPYVIFASVSHWPAHGPMILHIAICFGYLLCVWLCQKSARNVLNVEHRWRDVKAIRDEGECKARRVEG
jgi:hypothetical protein